MNTNVIFLFSFVDLPIKICMQKKSEPSRISVIFMTAKYVNWIK